MPLYSEGKPSVTGFWASQLSKPELAHPPLVHSCSICSIGHRETAATSIWQARRWRSIHPNRYRAASVFESTMWRCQCALQGQRHWANLSFSVGLYLLTVMAPILGYFPTAPITPLIWEGCSIEVRIWGPSSSSCPWSNSAIENSNLVECGIANSFRESGWIEWMNRGWLQIRCLQKTFLLLLSRNVERG